MPQTPDRHPGILVEDDEIQLGPTAVPPSVVGALVYNGTRFVFRDSYGTYDPHRGVIERVVTADWTIAVGTTEVHRDTVISDGVAILISNSGELFIL